MMQFTSKKESGQHINKFKKKNKYLMPIKE